MNRIINFIVRDPLRKLLALALTVVLYVVLGEGKQQQRDFVNVPVVIEADNDVYLPLGSRSINVRLSVKGSESRLKKLSGNEISGKLVISRNTPGFESGAVTMQLSGEYFTLPRGISISSIDPVSVSLPVQRRISRQIAIFPEITGQPGHGFVHSKTSCLPENVTVSGPEQLVISQSEIRTETVNIRSGENHSFSKSVKLTNPMPGELSLNIDSCDVSVTISSVPVRENTLPEIPVRWLLPPGKKYKIEPENISVKVKVSGQPGVVDAVSDKDVTVFANLLAPEFAKGGEFTVALQPTLNDPAGKLQIKTDPEKVTVKIEVLN